MIQKVQNWADPSEVEARLQRDMESQGMNHDRVGGMLLYMYCVGCGPWLGHSKRMIRVHHRYTVGTNF